MLYDPELFRLFQREKTAVLGRDSAILGKIIRRCVELKAQVVEEDFTEKGRRMELNLGHTFAHALESTLGLGEITHGDAVAWGMARALDLGLNKGLTSPAWAEEAKTLLAEYGWCTDSEHTSIKEQRAKSREQREEKREKGEERKEKGEGFSVREKILGYIKSDKKKRDGAVRFVLQRELGVTEIVTAEDSEVLEVLS
jgi:3-dehydroquinate synthase